MKKVGVGVAVAVGIGDGANRVGVGVPVWGSAVGVEIRIVGEDIGVSGTEMVDPQAEERKTSREESMMFLFMSSFFHSLFELIE